MFLHKLNAEQRQAFLVMAQRISMADGEDDMGELDDIENLKAQLGLSYNPDMSEVLGDLPLAPFDTVESRVIAMMELLAIAYTDDYLHEAESDLIGDVASAFGFSQEQLNAIAGWSMNALDLRREGEALLSGGG